MDKTFVFHLRIGKRLFIFSLGLKVIKRDPRALLTLEQLIAHYGLNKMIQDRSSTTRSTK